VFVLDEQPPPGCADDQRLVVLIGTPVQVSTATAEIAAMLALQIDLGTATSASPAMGSLMPPGLGVPGLGVPGFNGPGFNGPGFNGAGRGGRPSGAVGVRPSGLLPTFTRLLNGYPDPSMRWGERIAQREAIEGNVRHDLLAGKGIIGKLIGPQGSTKRELALRTGCDVFVLDEQPPPGCADDQRLVVLIGTPVQVSTATAEIAAMLALQIDLGTATPTPVAPALSAGPMTSTEWPAMGGVDPYMGMGAAQMQAPGGYMPQQHLPQQHMPQRPMPSHSMPPPAAPFTMPPPLLTELTRVARNWPDPGSTVGKRIAEAEAAPGNLRHELLVEKGVLGRLIGSGGSKLRDLQARTSCHIFVVDKEVPPGRTGETRAVVLVGPLPSLSAATQEVESVVEARPPKRPAAEAFSAEDAIREAKRRFYGS